MGVYIPNMENPKTCGECEARHLAKCGVTLQWLLAPEGYYKTKKEDCQLVEIVRCEECKYWTGDCTNEIWQSPTDDYLPQTNADDFCSYGERRADGDI